MARNSLQTFDTPAADKNAQYFAWDLVMRTVARSNSSNPESKETGNAAPKCNERHHKD